MKITSFNIERFGIWEHLSLPKISCGLNLFYGPNEAGKTTLLQFFRSAVYGAGGDDRARYIRLALGVDDKNADVKSVVSKNIADDDLAAGGSLTVRTEFGTYRLERRYLRRNSAFYDRQSALEAKSGFVAQGGLAEFSGRFYPLPGTGIAESLIVTGPDGARLSDYFVKTLVNNVDEATFNNVFAIGLDELQKLGTLSETDAAQMLYRLSVGIDRVSLIRVLHQIVDERNEAFDAKGKPSILEGLIAERNKVAAENKISSVLLRDYVRIFTERGEADDALEKLSEALTAERRHKRIYETARAVAGLWDRRALLREKIAAAGTVTDISESAAAESARLAGACAETFEKLNALKRDYRAAQSSLAAIRYSEPVRENAPRIELFEEDLPRISALADEITAAETEIVRLEQELTGEEERLKGIRHGKVTLTRSIVDAHADANPLDGEKALPTDDYRILARSVRQSRKRYRQVKAMSAEVNERLAALTERLDRQLSERGEKNLDEALGTTAGQVTRLRRRAEIGRKLGDMERERKELIRLNEHLAANQALPLPMTLGIAAVAAVGGLLAVLAFMGKANIDLGLGVLGLIAAAAGLVYKTTAEKKNYAALVENQRQLSALMKRIANTKDEGAAIDAEIPAAGQTIEIRLQKAEADLAAFEQLVPVEAKWNETSRHAKTLENRLENAHNAVRKAQKRWTAWLQSVGLSEDLNPTAIRSLLERADVADSLRRKIDIARGNLDLLRREWKSFSDRLARLFAVTKIAPPADRSPLTQFEALRTALDQVNTALGQRADIHRRCAEMLKTRRVLLDESHRRRHELADFLSLFDAKSTDELNALANRSKEYKSFLAQAAETQNQIDAALGTLCAEDEIDPLLSDASVRAELAATEEEIVERITALEGERALKEQLRGRLTEQLTALAARKESVKSRFETAALDLRIERMAALWRSRAVACGLMEDIRAAYEKERQPQALHEASTLLSRLTDGRYVKIWTPLGEETLFVDTDSGKTLDVGDLSRGVREQLFIAIRLALTGSFEKHGISLPLILDDVLVNFDNRRAECAAKMLREFAAAGRQIFLFTCHEHICRTFLELGTPVFVLPERTERQKKFRVLMPETPQPEPLAPEPESVEVKSVSVSPEPAPTIIVESFATEKTPHFSDYSAPERVTNVVPAEIILRPAGSAQTTEAAAEPAAEPIQPTESTKPVEPDRGTLGLLDLFIDTTPEEAEADRARRSPITFSAWDDLFPKREEGPVEPSQNEEPDEPLLKDSTFVADSADSFWKHPRGNDE